jgi:hypothetical protein
MNETAEFDFTAYGRWRKYFGPRRLQRVAIFCSPGTKGSTFELECCGRSLPDSLTDTKINRRTTPSIRLKLGIALQAIFV